MARIRLQAYMAGASGVPDSLLHHQLYISIRAERRAKEVRKRGLW